MCVVDRRTYVHANGRRETIETSHPCKYSDGRSLCPNTTTEYSETSWQPQSPSYSLASPASSTFPPTPPTYSTIEARPSPELPHRNSPQGRGARYIKPEVTVHIGGRSKRETKYNRLSGGSSVSNHSSDSGRPLSSDQRTTSRRSVNITLGSTSGASNNQPSRNAHFEDDVEPESPSQGRRRRPSVVINQQTESLRPALRTAVPRDQRQPVSADRPDTEYQDREASRASLRAEHTHEKRRQEEQDRRTAENLARAQVNKAFAEKRTYQTREPQRQRSDANDQYDQRHNRLEQDRQATEQRRHQKAKDAQTSKRTDDQAVRKASKKEKEDQRRKDAQNEALNDTYRQMEEERRATAAREHLESQATLNYDPRAEPYFAPQSIPALRHENRYITADPYHASPPPPHNAVVHQPRNTRIVAPPGQYPSAYPRTFQDRQNDVLHQAAAESSRRLQNVVGDLSLSDEEDHRPPPPRRRNTNTSRRASVSYNNDDKPRRKKPYFD